jgi:putative endonuclease
MKRNVKQNNRSVGAVYEQAAGYYLEQNGYELIEYNYRCRDGEIDIIAKDGDCYVFCEVKYRSGRQAGNPLEAVEKRFFGVRCTIRYSMELKMRSAALM